MPKTAVELDQVTLPSRLPICVLLQPAAPLPVCTVRLAPPATVINPEVL